MNWDGWRMWKNLIPCFTCGLLLQISSIAASGADDPLGEAARLSAGGDTSAALSLLAVHLKSAPLASIPVRSSNCAVV